MSLEGNLTAFGLSEIFQLIAVQQKSGMLTVRSGDRSKVLFFREGQVVSTRDRRHKTRDPLKDYLTRYGILSREDLLRVLQISSQSKLDITDVLVSERFLTEEEIKLHFRNHMQEEIHELLTWEQCSYKFLPGDDILEGIKRLGEFSVEGMLMESMRRIDELAVMRELLPDLAVVVTRRGDAEPGEDLHPNAKTVLALLSRPRSLGYLISRGRMPKFNVYEALKHLHEMGVVEIDTSDVAEETETQVKRSRRRRKMRNVLPLLVSIAAFVAAAAWGARSTIPLMRAKVDPEARHSTQTDSVVRNRLEDAIRFRLEAYYATHGMYPRDLAALKEAGLATDAFLRQVQSMAFRYRLTAGGARYTLL